MFELYVGSVYVCLGFIFLRTLRDIYKHYFTVGDIIPIGIVLIGAFVPLINVMITFCILMSLLS